MAAATATARVMTQRRPMGEARSSRTSWLRLQASEREQVVLSPGDVVLVAGATGGVGQVLTEKLVEVSREAIQIQTKNTNSLSRV
jgi:NADPH:quinone reductase-like Zn-dependent oxidoreductase